MPKPGDEPVELECVFLGRGPASVMLRFQEVHEKREIRIPISAIHDDNEFDYESAVRHDVGTITIKQWLAEKEGLV